MLIFFREMSKEKASFSNNNNSRDWYSNKYQIVLLQKNLFSLFTIFALVSVIIAVFFVKNITESKTFEPFVIEMEDKTGRIQVVENLTTQKISDNEVIKRFYIYNFLLAAEGYNHATYKEDMIKLGLFSDSIVYRQLMNRLSARNDYSPVKVLGNNGYMYIQIKSIIFLTQKSASIRFRIVNETKSSYFPNRDVVAYIEFDFKNLELTERERLINPLGFQVSKYRLDNDLMP